MDAFLVSTGLVALAEFGDKTQLLALVLTAKFRRPLPILAGILVATLANHGLAGWAGRWSVELVQFGPGAAALLRWVVALSFLAMAGWSLVPDRLNDDGAPVTARHGVFVATLLAFFVAELGDKTQIATVLLAARFDGWITVVIGTTLGMMIANVPAVLLGNLAAERIPIRLLRTIAAGVFAVIGIWALVGAAVPAIG